MSRRPITSGQTVSGTFVENGDTSDVASDYNLYYFVGTAGSRIDVAMERVDTSVPWEHPDSLDPEIRVIAPDGFVYENLLAFDNRESLDLDSALQDALLPQTGVYVIAASTTRGHGAYRLAFHAVSVASAGTGERVVPTSGNYETLLVGATSESTSVVLDPLGQPLSGAGITWDASHGDGETGTVRFEAGTLYETSVDGFARATVTHLSRGKVSLGPLVTSPVLASWVVVSAEPAFRSQSAPRYAPAGYWPLRIVDLGPGSSLRLSGPAPKEIRTHKPKALAETWLGAGDLKEARSGSGRQKALGAAAPGGSADTLTRTDAATAEPLSSLLASLSPVACVAPLGRTTKYAVDATELRPPYSITLTDVDTTQPVAEDGIKDARIESVLHLRLEIKDAAQQTPTHPVLVRFRVGGSRHGTLILDPAGLHTECTDGSFVWHPVDEQGVPIPGQLNELFDYRLGTLSRYVGVEPDPDHPGQVRPVWGTTEALELQLLVESPTGVPLFSRIVEVHPRPGKPHHFVLNAAAEPPHTFRVWPDYRVFPDGTKQDGGTRLRAGFSMGQAYVLEDRYDNRLWGYDATTVAPTDPRVQTTFISQAQAGEEYLGYRLVTSWTDDPVMPDGNVSATLGVTYNDPDPAIGSGQVSQPITYLFERGMMKAVVRRASYDRVRPDGTIVADDGTFPITVSPAAGTTDPTSLPKTEAGDGKRLVLLTLSGNSITGVEPSPEVYPSGHKTWKKVADPGGSGTWHWEQDQELTPNPFLVTREMATFRMTLVDRYGRTAVDGRFVVHRCPRWDHDSPNAPDLPGRECTLGLLDSGGTRVVARVEVNPSTEPLDYQRGYMGIELVKAPTNPGTYYVKLEALDGAPWRLNRQADIHFDETAAGQYQGGFALCTVSGAEFLDKDFRRIEPLLVSQPIPAYLRVVRAEADAGANTLALKLSTKTDDGQPVTPATNISLARVGSSSTFLGALTLVPSEYPSQPNLRAGEDPAPTFVAPLGFGELKATTASDAEIALRGILFPPKLVLSFLKREAECAFTIDTCLTSGPEGTQPGSLQQTEIDPGNGYAEVVRMLVRTVNPFRESILEELTGGALRFEERALHEYQEKPSLLRYSKFYEGLRGSSSIEDDGTLKGPSGDVEEHALTEGRAAFTLAAVATARYDALGQVIRTDLQGPGLGYETGIRVKTRLRSRSGNEWPLESEDFHIGQWVNERRYCRNRVAPSLGWCDPPSRATDWLEMRALDFLSAPSSAKAPEADTVLARVTTIVDDWNLPPPTDGQVLTSASSEIRLKPEWVSFRLPASLSGERYFGTYWGLGYEYNSGFAFDLLISHEARHAWAFQLGSAEGRTDGENDWLYLNPPSATPELTDAAFPGNPELTFQGDTVNETNRAEWHAAHERAAVRWARKNVGGEARCLEYSWSLTYDSSLQVITANGLYTAWNGCPSPAAGFAFRVESAPSGTSCEAADDAWHSEGVFSLDMDGRAVVAPPAAGEYRFGLILPSGECPVGVERSCTSVPAR